MIKSIKVEAATLAEAFVDVSKIYVAFGNDVNVDLTVTQNSNINVEVGAQPLGYSFNWLANNSGDARKELVDEITNKVVETVTAAVEKSNAVRQYKTQEGTNMLGAIEFNVITDMTKLPQKVASAAATIENAGLVGASYKPIVFCGTQLVRGTNYLFIAEQTLVTATPTKRVVSLKVNEFQGKFEIVKDSIKVIFG